jgi:hypothetical protein
VDIEYRRWLSWDSAAGPLEDSALLKTSRDCVAEDRLPTTDSNLDSLTFAYLSTKDGSYEMRCLRDI